MATRKTAAQQPATPEAVKPGTVWAGDGDLRLLVGYERRPGKYEVWRLKYGGWEMRLELVTAARVRRTHPRYVRSGVPIPTTSPCRDWESAYLELEARASRTARTEPERPTADDNRAGYAALVGQAETELAAVKSDNVALLAELQQMLHWANRYHHKDVVESLNQLLAQSHPGAALLERLRKLEEALSDAAQDLGVWAEMPDVPEGIRRALSKRAEGIQALLAKVKS